MAMTEAEKKEARKARRVIQKAAKKAGMSTKEYRAKLAKETYPEAPKTEAETREDETFEETA